MKTKSALTAHEVWCRRNASSIEEGSLLDELVEEVRGLFDWRAWAREFVAGEKAVIGPNAAIVDFDSHSSSSSEDAMDTDSAPKKRHRLSLKAKVRILDSFDQVKAALSTKFGRPESVFTKKDVFTVIARTGGHKLGTISKIFWEEQKLRDRYANKFNRRRFTFGSGLTAQFPATEADLAAQIRIKRERNLSVSAELTMEEYQRLAFKENKDLAAKSKFSEDLFYAFLKRQRLARRKPSNIKSMTLKESQQLVRGFLQYLLSILIGLILVAVGSKSPTIDPTFGRFPLDCRLNKDEVGGYLGEPSLDIISELGESSTKALMLEHWGERIATLIVTLTPLKMLKMGIVFRGGGKRLAKDEDAYYKTLEHVEVFFQKKAWVDGTVELEIVKRILIPHAKAVKADYVARGMEFPGILDVEDNFSAHLDQYPSSPLCLRPFFLSFPYLNSPCHINLAHCESSLANRTF